MGNETVSGWGGFVDWVGGIIDPAVDLYRQIKGAKNVDANDKSVTDVYKQQLADEKEKDKKMIVYVVLAAVALIIIIYLMKR